ncbi:MAG: hypothetical protein IPQ10_06140 [Saprospiraceae bacterium]|nr:hypothetical protein [Saprospiraceae bacterium]MBK7795527.1 hypothetical protein [Saprospiraceae bacterium]MBL0260635.1 hypothetical protein [Saprospiraceae bacterium]
MKKINSYFAIGLLCVFGQNDVLAQWDTDNQNRIFVSINPEGCPVYDHPDNRELIDTIPFGRLLSKTNISETKYDSIYCGSWVSRGILKKNPNSSPTLCAGYWLKINLQGKVGWIWDGFIRNLDHVVDSGLGMVKQFYQPEFRSDFILLRAGVSYQSEFKYNHEWHWYGLSQVGCNTVLHEISGLSHFISIDGDKMK